MTVPRSKEEQEKIANCLSSLDSLIKAETDKLEHLKDHKKGLLQQLFPAKGETKPQFRFPEFENDGDWEEKELGEVAKFRRGSFPQPYGLPKWYDDKNGHPFVQVYDVAKNLRLKFKTKRKISELAAEQSVFIEKGTVIITIQGSIGRVAITQYDAYIDRTLLLFEEFFRPFDKLFFAYVLQTLFEIEKQNAPGGIIKTITKQVLTQFKIFIPEIKEQEKIGECLFSIDNLIEAQTTKMESLKAHKKGLMQQLFPNVNSLVI
jgi:type I restriction enzyme S subunit